MEQKIKKPVTERMVHFYAQFTVRIWVDVSDLIKLKDAVREVQQRENSVRAMFTLLLRGKQTTIEATKAVIDALPHTAMEPVINAFEITDVEGNGYVQYIDWP